MMCLDDQVKNQPTAYHAELDTALAMLAIPATLLRGSVMANVVPAPVLDVKAIVP